MYPHYNSIHSFLNRRLTMFTSGVGWDYGRTFSPVSSVIPSQYFDGMIFIKETSSSILTPGGEQEIAKRIAEGK